MYNGLAAEEVLVLGGRALFETGPSVLRFCFVFTAMPLLLRGRIVTWCSVLLLCPLAGICTFFFAWNLSRKWPNPDNVTKIFKSELFRSLWQCTER